MKTAMTEILLVEMVAEATASLNSAEITFKTPMRSATMATPLTETVVTPTVPLQVAAMELFCQEKAPVFQATSSLSEQIRVLSQLETSTKTANKISPLLIATQIMSASSLVIGPALSLPLLPSPQEQFRV